MNSSLQYLFIENLKYRLTTQKYLHKEPEILPESILSTILNSRGTVRQ